MNSGECLWEDVRKRSPSGDFVPELHHLVHPVTQARWHIRPRGRGHSRGEGVDVVLAKIARCFGVGGVLVWGHIPHWSHRHPMNSTDFVHADQPVGAPLVGFECLAVHPSSGIAIPLHLHVFLERLGTDGATVLGEGFDFSKYERVALQRRRVMSLEVPDVRPDRLSFLRRGKPAQTLPKIGEGSVELSVDGLSAGSSSCHGASPCRVVAPPALELIRSCATELNIST